MSTRKTFGPGWFGWFLIACILYFALGVAWWSFIFMAVWSFVLGTLGSLVGGEEAATVGIEAMRVWVNPWGTPRLALMLLFWLIHTMVLVRHVRWPYHRWWVALTYPVALPLLFPFIFAWARLYQMHETWEHSSDTVEAFEADDLDDEPDDEHVGHQDAHDDIAEQMLTALGASQSTY